MALPLVICLCSFIHKQIPSDKDSSPETTPKSSPKRPEHDPNINPCNPFYIHPGKNPGAVLVSPSLDDHNYHNWSKSMRRALTSKNKLGFINGKLKKPPFSDQNYEHWERANNLRERFTKGNHFRFSDLLRELHSIQQGDRSLSAYFTAMKILWDELEDLRPTPSCSCITPCTYDLAKAVRNYKHMEYVTCFLKGLNDSYQNIRTQILLLDPLPSISRTYSLIAQQEISNPSALASTILSAAASQTNNSRAKGKSTPKSNMFCTNCHKTNHTIDTCYFKHGFPPGYRSNNSNKSTSDSKSSQPPKSTTDNKDTGISKEDYQHLVLLLQQSRKDNQTPKEDKAIISGIVPTGSMLNIPSI
ncbi:uncharacterized protein LOC131648635 [Vicia villosa]|uniref:uncharacterized protein LOC131648635 n=1 Tax=Vicia villosa TaxID=3911 RepID=UPI00273AD9ED|nr:uncharacterized protein LOC131648635 [Vicia villosa]